MTMDPAQDRALLHLGQALRDRGYHFITPTPLTHERVNQRPENALADDLHGVFG
ncbi:MAG: SAM-dependent methyltransferase, partial [Gammaproteobacteria bacterium]